MMSEPTFPTVKNYPRIALDTETTGLAKNDVPVGISWATPDGQAGYLRWGHKEGGNNTTLRRVQEWAEEQFRDYRGEVIFHESLFDLRMLDNVSIPLFDWGLSIQDTKFQAAIINELSRSFSLGPTLKQYNTNLQKESDELNAVIRERFTKPKGGGVRWEAGYYWVVSGALVEPYAISDAVGTLALYDIFEPLIDKRDLREVYELERSLIPMLAKMYRHGVRVDVERAVRERDRIAQEIEERIGEWEKVSGGVPLSGPGSQKLLKERWAELGLPFEQTKLEQRKNLPGSSINKVAIDKAKDIHRLPSLLEELRTREKMVGTFFPYILDHQVDGRVHSTFHPLKTDDYGTVSGRFSSSDPNLQNPYSPDKDDESAPPEDQYGHLFRSLFVPEQGRQWASLDYSQIEYRLFAHYAGGSVLQAYLDDPDVDFHQMVADMTGMDRSEAKNVNFAKLFGAGSGKLANMIGVSRQEAIDFMNLYEAKIPDAANMMKLVERRAAQRGYIRTISGRKRRFHKRQGRFVGTHAALNALVQGGAADIMKKAMVDLDEIIDWDAVVLHLTVHDEVDVSVPRGAEGDRWLRDAREIMENAMDLSLPILVGVEVGENWGYLNDWEE